MASTSTRCKLTAQQSQAVTTRDVSVALSAGAGCGKTFVLTERFLAQLDPGDGSAPRLRNLSELVAITFTETAAREMRDRIRTKCVERLEQAASDEEVDYWLELLRSLDAARVSTIHSFCASLLRSHAVEARLDPQFRVLEQSQAETLLAELVDDVLRRNLAECDETTVELVVTFGLDQVRKMLLRLVTQERDADFSKWLTRTPEEQVAVWEDYLQAAVLPNVASELAGWAETKRLLAMFRESAPGEVLNGPQCKSLLEKLNQLGSSHDVLGDLRAIRECTKLGRMQKIWSDDSTYPDFRDALEKFRKKVGSTVDYLEFDREAALADARAGLQLLKVANGVRSEFDERKRELGVLDFDDLLVRTWRLLTDPEQVAVREELSADILLLLVDEFQDTDRVQVELIKALCGETFEQGKLFFVGDYKQSIYRFRGAEPDVFNALRQATPEKGRLPLTHNFRSQPGVLAFVNALFCETLGQEYEPLRATRAQLSPGASVEFWWTLSSDGATMKKECHAARRQEAENIARRLRMMLDSDAEVIPDGATLRCVKPGDIGLLFRALSDVEVYEKALRKHEIPYYLVGGHAFYSQQEVFDVLNLLRSVAVTGDEVSLAGVLRSPFFSLADETLFWLAQHPGGLAAGLFSPMHASEIDPAQRRRVAFAAKTLSELHAMKDRVPIAALINEALTRTGYDAILLAEFLGERKLANLQKLIEQARTFDRTQFLQLDDFLVQLSEFVARQPKEALAATNPESEEVVRLMTIHQSKGLEFPIVVVPDLDRRSNSGYESAVYTDALGPLVHCPRGADQKDARSGLALHRVIEAEQDKHELARVLYVATTRAADRLIISSSLSDIDSPQGPWTKLLGERFDLSTGKLKVAIPADYEQPRVEVIVESGSVDSKPGGYNRRRDLVEIVEQAARLAKSSGGIVPTGVAPLALSRAGARRFSFSMLTGHLREAEPIAPVLALVKEDGEATPVDPLELGRLVHQALAVIPLGQTVDVSELVDRFAEHSLLEPGLTTADAVDMISRFLISSRAEALANAAEVHREIEFLLAWPPGTNVASGQYFQGFIDCLYRDSAVGWHVFDYKTNRVNAEGVPTAAAAYKLQMYVYALAAQQILGAAPASLSLHFLWPGVEHIFPWNEQTQRRAVEMIDEALARAAAADYPAY